MTTTEPTVADLDDQLDNIDGAHASLLGQVNDIEAEIREIDAELTDRAAAGTIAPDLAGRLEERKQTLDVARQAIARNRVRHQEVTEQRQALVYFLENEAVLSQYRADLAAFKARLDAEALVNRLKDAVYWLFRATMAEYRDLWVEQQRLTAVASGHLSVEQPPDRCLLPFSTDITVRGPHACMVAVRGTVDFWSGEVRAAAGIGDYLKTRTHVVSRDNPNESAPTWSQVIEGVAGGPRDVAAGSA